MSAAASPRSLETTRAVRLAGSRSLSFPPGRWPARPPRRLSPLLLLALLSLLAAGCTAPRQVAIPGRLRTPSAVAPASPASPSPAHAPPSTRQRVVAAYRGYWRAYEAAWRSRNPARVRQILARYVVPGGIGLDLTSDRQLWARHQAPDGAAVPHVLSVRLHGRTAALHDCLDLSHLGDADTRTGQLIPDSFGPPRMNFYVTLVLASGQWLVRTFAEAVQPCRP